MKHRALAIIFLMLSTVVFAYTTHTATGASLALVQKWSYPTDAIYSSPAIADLDGDGHLEIIVGSTNDHVYCLNETGGVKWIHQTLGAVYGSATVADLNGDGKLEVLVATILHVLYCLNSTGGEVWSHVLGGAIYSSPTVADVDGDGQKEILLGGDDHLVYCLNRTGGVEWTYTAGGEVQTPPIAIDIDGDGKKEVLVGSWDHNIYCLNSTGGLKWKYMADHCIYYSLAVGDLFGDGKMETVFGTAVAEVSNQSVYCLNSTGGLMWRYTTDGGVFYSPTVADVDGDGQPEVLVAAWTPNPGIFCFSNRGLLKWRFEETGAASATPIVSDLDGDGKSEILAASWTLFCLTGTGALEYANYTGPPGPGGFFYSSPTLADLDHDGRLEVLVGSWDNGNGAVYCFGVIPVTETPLAEALIPFAAIGLVVAFSITGVALFVRKRSSIHGDASVQTRPDDEMSGNTSGIAGATIAKTNFVSSRGLCPNCGAKIGSPSAQFCPYCGANLLAEARGVARGGACIVCNLQLKPGEELVRCPHCGAAGHKAHFLEWVHVKGYCPTCGERLNEEELH